MWEDAYLVLGPYHYMLVTLLHNLVRVHERLAWNVGSARKGRAEFWGHMARCRALGLNIWCTMARRRPSFSCNRAREFRFRWRVERDKVSAVGGRTHFERQFFFGEKKSPPTKKSMEKLYRCPITMHLPVFPVVAEDGMVMVR